VTRLYAQLNGDGVCAAISVLAGEVDALDMIPISENEYAAGQPLGMKYQDGGWLPIEGDLNNEPDQG
jgi:hypothetical protein